jgi:hypothetical protein
MYGNFSKSNHKTLRQDEQDFSGLTEPEKIEIPASMGQACQSCENPVHPVSPYVPMLVVSI